MKYFPWAIALCSIVCMQYGCQVFHKSNKSATHVAASTSSLSFDSANKKMSDTTRPRTVPPKPYNSIITAKAKTDTGLFTIHQVADKYYAEIPDSVLGQDILIVSRIAKSATGNRPQKGFLGYAGDEINENVVRFVKGPNHKLFLKSISYTERSSDSSSNGMYRSVVNSNLQPIAAAFDIKAYRPDSAAIVIDLTDYLSGDNNILFYDGKVKKAFGLGGLQADKSYIGSVTAFPINVEITTVKTYANGDATSTFELNTSMVLLPRQVMHSRLADDRVGYFATKFMDFDAPDGVKPVAMINRWRLEPKEEDIDKYLRGELVEPKKPIVFYIDPATPKKWVPYLIAGINDWQKAFEQAGFKNAIYALEAPTDDPDFSLLDARHNAVIYKPSVVANASGPHVHDPRSGEILETHVNWYHNVMQLLHDWYFIQAGAIDPKARTMQFSDSLMGELIRFVSSHEIGHTLGLTHNFGSSSTVPVDSLRSKAWVEANGHTPSIMDYARFNYVAQPEDSISEKGIFPRIGMYDKWAIEWGYRWLPQLKTREEEKAYMNQWIISKLREDKRYWYGPQMVLGVSDPRNQSEDLGDDAMKAGYYGIKNLKRIVEHLEEWTEEPNEDYANLKSLNNQVIVQYRRYLDHVANNIGLYRWNYNTVEQKGDVVEFTPREKQRAAVHFLQEQLFTTPEWLMNKDIFSKIGGYGPNLPIVIQVPLLAKLISNSTYTALLYFEGQEPAQAYTFPALLNDLETGIWRELQTGQPIDLCRRNLEKAYAERLIEVYDPSTSVNPVEKMGLYYHLRSDLYTIVREQMKGLIARINKALPLYKDKLTHEHLLGIKERLDYTLENPNYQRDKPVSTKASNDTGISLWQQAAIPLEEANPFEFNPVHLVHSGCGYFEQAGSLDDI